MRHFFLIGDSEYDSNRFLTVYYNDRTNTLIVVKDWEHNLIDICKETNNIFAKVSNYNGTCLKDAISYITNVGRGHRKLIQLPCLPYPTMPDDYPELFL